MLVEANTSNALHHLAYRMPSGVYLAHEFVYKVGSMEWNHLLLKAMIGKSGGVKANMAKSLLRSAHVPTFEFADLPANASTHTLCIIRNPYERMLSAYENKVVHEKDVRCWPPGLHRGASFAAFVKQVALHGPKSPAMALQHWGPISERWGWVCNSAKQRMVGGATAGTNDVVKVEQTSEWYGRVIRSLGWEKAASYSRWNGGCFFKPRGTSCQTALVQAEHANDTSSSKNMNSAPTDKAGADIEHAMPTADELAAIARQVSNRTGKATSTEITAVCARHALRRDFMSIEACLKMEHHYTPELARMVARYSRNDLELYGYPEWDGNLRNRWF